MLGIAAAALLALAAGCSGGSGSEDTRSAPAAEKQADALVGGAADDQAARTSGELAEAEEQGQVQQASKPARQAVISTGTVSLEADDVAAARFEVQKVVDRHDGTVSDQETSSGDDGQMETARLVLRVPSADFEAVVAELEKVATLTGSTSSTDDVTTRVIDNRARIRAQEGSLRRIEALLAEADDLRQVIAIESELTRRQAELDSLKKQRAWLADQTSLSTVTVHLERPDAQAEDDEEAGGFLGGLEQGWNSLLAGLAVALTVVGFLLPFAVLVGVLALPVWLALRGRRSARTPSAGAAGPGPSTG